MKLLACVLTALLLSACASINGAGSAPVAEATQTGTYYCWKSRLGTEGDSLHCNWERTKGDACRLDNGTPIARGSIASGPTDAGRCDNGQWLVQVTTR